MKPKPRGIISPGYAPNTAHAPAALRPPFFLSSRHLQSIFLPVSRHFQSSLASCLPLFPVQPLFPCQSLSHALPLGWKSCRHTSPVLRRQSGCGAWTHRVGTLGRLRVEGGGRQDGTRPSTCTWVRGSEAALPPRVASHPRRSASAPWQRPPGTCSDRPRTEVPCTLASCGGGGAEVGTGSGYKARGLCGRKAAAAGPSSVLPGLYVNRYSENGGTVFSSFKKNH